MEQLLAEVLLSCAHKMADREATLDRYTSETYQHELNLAFQFGMEARGWFSWLDCDFDVAKRNLDRKRPDIIFHRRGYHGANFLVVEIKREYDVAGAEGDLQKIKTDWFSDHLLYRFGASLRLRNDGYPVAVAVISSANPSQIVRITATSNYARQCAPPGEGTELSEMKALVDRVVTDRFDVGWSQR